MSSNLKAFWVGDMDIYAAESAEQALRLANEQHGGEFDTFDEDDVSEVTAERLDKVIPEFDENEAPTGETTTLRKWLEQAVIPDWLCGMEI
jgi:hypothetical protein